MPAKTMFAAAERIRVFAEIIHITYLTDQPYTLLIPANRLHRMKK
jgi:hypothetical protein